MISDQSARQKIVSELDSSFAVDAGAGTGKTTLLIDRLVALLLEKGVLLARIAAITFTDKAAGELVERLRLRLEKEFDSENFKKFSPAIQKEWENRIRRAIKDLEQASVSTIHSFCSSLLREYPVEVGVDPQFTVLDQVQSDALEDEAWESWLKKSLARPVESLMPFFRLGGSFEHLEKLKNHLLNNRSMLAPPEAPDLPDPKSTLEDMERTWVLIQEKTKAISSDDSLVKKLRTFTKTWQEAVLPGDKLVYALAGLVIPKVGNVGTQANWGKENLTYVKAQIEMLRETQESYGAQVKNAAIEKAALWLWDYLMEYAQVKTRQGLLDFDDLLSKTRDLVKDRLEVREELKKRYDHLFVDEFQDTDPLQVEIVFFLSEKSKSKAKTWQKVELEPGKLFLVGDPQQSIYRFRRADVEIYSEAKARLEACGGRVEKLTENFRTLSPIVDWINEGFEKLFEGGPFPYNAQKAHRQLDKQLNRLSPLIGLEMPEIPEEEQSMGAFRELEAETVGDFIEQLLQEKPLITDPKSPKDKPVLRPLQEGDIAILFRELSNTESVYENALRRRQIQFQIVGGKKFYNRPEIVALETLLTCLESPADEANLAALLRSPLFGFADEELFLYRERGGAFQFLRAASGKMGGAFRHLRQWYLETRQLSPAETLLYLYEKTNLLAVASCQPHGEQRVANLMKVVNQCRDLEESQNFTYRSFVKWLAKQREEDAMEGEAPGPEETGHQVTLMTLHKAKGLEFPVVILSGAAPEKPRRSDFIVNRQKGTAQFKVGDKDLRLCTAGFDKTQEEEESQEKAEILRLLYVGCTRAKESLVIPLFTQEKGGGFLKPITGSFDLKALKTQKVTAVQDRLAASALAVDLAEKDKNSQLVEDQKKYLTQLEEMKKALVEKRRGKTQLQSVTSVAHSEDDKLQREGYFLEGEVQPVSGDRQGKAFGVLTHQLLEKGWNWNEATLIKAGNLWAPAMGLSIEKAKEAADLVAQALRNDLLKRARASSHIFRELSLTGKNSDGVYLNAVIDLAFLEDGAWVVVDYKTDQDSQRGLEAYQKQIGHYSGLLETFTGLTVKESCLYFLRQDQVVKVQ
jgi:ATP-dependent exoDNAse (exonuclease V) beta subunit